MDSRGSGWSSNCSSSNNKNNSNNNSGNRGSSKDHGLGQGGRGGSPSDYYYGGGAGGDVEGSPKQGLYTTNNNDYSKYNSEHLPSGGPDYSHYAADSPRGDYSSSPYDVKYRAEYSSDSRHSVNSDCEQCQQGHTSYANSQCCGDYNQGGCGSCCQSGYSNCDQYGTCNQPECAPSQVQVTAKVLFGSVSAISNLKQKKPTKK